MKRRRLEGRGRKRDEAPTSRTFFALNFFGTSSWCLHKRISLVGKIYVDGGGVRPVSGAQTATLRHCFRRDDGILAAFNGVTVNMGEKSGHSAMWKQAHRLARLLLVFSNAY